MHKLEILFAVGMCNMNKIYVITKDYYEDSVLCNVRILGYVTSEAEAQKILVELNNDDINYSEVEYYDE